MKKVITLCVLFVLTALSNYGVVANSPRPWQISGNGVSYTTMIFMLCSLFLTGFLLFFFIRVSKEVILKLDTKYKAITGIISLSISIFLFYIGRIRFYDVYESLKRPFTQYVIPINYGLWEAWIGGFTFIFAIMSIYPIINRTISKLNNKYRAIIATISTLLSICFFYMGRIRLINIYETIRFLQWKFLFPVCSEAWQVWVGSFAFSVAAICIYFIRRSFISTKTRSL